MPIRHLPLPAFALFAGLAVPAHAQDGTESDPTDLEIVVTAQRENEVRVEASGDLGALGDQSAQNVPFTVRTFDESLVVDQQPLSLADVLKNDPTVQTAYAFGNAAELFVIRGFPLNGDDVGLNGLYGITPRQLVAPELYEGIQVLNGANAFLNGAAPGGSGLGGNVNLELKQARSEPLTRVTGSYLSDGHFGGSVDVSRRFGSDDAVGVRLNGVYRDGEVAVEGEDRKTLALGAGLDFATDNLRLALNVGYQDIRVDRLRPQVIVSTGIPAVPDGDYNYGADFTYTDLESVFGVASLEYDVADNATFYVTAGATEMDEEGIYASVTVADPVTGAGSFNFPNFIPYEASNQSIESGIRIALGDTITHRFNFGGNITWKEERTAYDFRTTIPTNLYDVTDAPFPADTAFAGGDVDDPYPIFTSRLWSAFASDTIGLLDDRVLVTGGLRLQTIRARTFSYFGGGLDAEYEENAVTPVAGLVVKPVDGLSLFANRIEGLVQGDTVPLTGPNPNAPGTLPVANAGEVLTPFRSVQYEAGAKLTLPQLTGTLTAFTTDRPSNGTRLAPGSMTQLVGGAFGEQRNRGVELFLSAEPVDGLRLIGGATYVDAEITESDNPTLLGNAALGVPDWTANANVEWDIPFVRGLTLTGRVQHTGEQAANQTNTLTLDDWTIFDAGARYVLAAGDVPVTLRVAVDNVTDEEYWASAFTSFGGGDTARLLQGRPRTYRASVSIDF
ncbi:TonB-dependent receptor [Qipengyuania sp. JC766]|uniref:TonB-dependent receptor n=1 Tax=Qipengyuania sp. JC766 TaxID=3232139 RepID=UPI00345AA7E7